MSTPRMNTKGPVTRRLLKKLRLRDSDFFLVDVGASGGVESHWNVYGKCLKAVGFDPLVNEVERLNAGRRNKKVEYVAAFVGCDSVKGEMPTNVLSHWFARSSAQSGREAMNSDYIKEEFNAGQEVVYSDRRLQLDDFFTPDEHRQIDFIKTDTDGHDYPVLLGSEKLLSSGGVLGMSIEADLHGPDDPQANCFANIDRFMRRHGFSLVDMEIYRYSRAALPQPFMYDLTGQTRRGPVAWGEAIYLRDLAAPGYADAFPFEVTEEKILKLVTLFELFGLNDCAADTILAFRERYPSLADPELLNLLTPPMHGLKLSYEEYVQTFLANPVALYPSAKIKADPQPAQKAPATPTTPPPRTTLPPPPTRPTTRPAGLVERLRSVFSSKDAA